MFETKSIINENTFKALKKHLMPLALRITIIVFITLAAGAFIVSVVITSYSLMMASLAIIVVLTLDYRVTSNNLVKNSFKRLQETAHSGECAYTTSFDETGFKIINHSTNGSAVIRYGDIRRVAETEDFYALLTKTNQFGIIDRKAIDEAGKKEEFVSFIKGKCKKIRWEK